LIEITYFWREIGLRNRPHKRKRGGKFGRKTQLAGKFMGAYHEKKSCREKILPTKSRAPEKKNILPKNLPPEKEKKSAKKLRLKNTRYKLSQKKPTVQIFLVGQHRPLSLTQPRLPPQPDHIVRLQLQPEAVSLHVVGHLPLHQYS
jgi:hypothetical protein